MADLEPIEIDANGVVAFTRELVRIRSVSGPGSRGGEAPVAAAVEAKMRQFGWEPAVIEVAPGRPNVLAYVDGGAPDDGPTLMFEGHTDVVTEGPPQDWSVDPFGGVIREGRLYGRGSADMKSGLAASLYAAQALQQAGPFPGRILVAALVDEEGFMLGAKHFAASSAASRVDGAIIAEPEDGEICAVAKGAIRLRVDLHGVMAHGAMPDQGRNPIAGAGQLLTEIAAYERELQAEHGTHDHLGAVYLTPTVAHGGSTDQMNVIPPHCVLGIDVRTTPGVDHWKLIERVRTLVDEAGAAADVEAKLTVLDDRPCVDTPLDDPVVTALAAAHEAVTTAPPRYGGVPGATDGTILTRDAGIPTVVYGPGGKWIAHQADEYVELDEIVRCTRVFAEAARRFLHGGTL